MGPRDLYIFNKEITKWQSQHVRRQLQGTKQLSSKCHFSLREIRHTFNARAMKSAPWGKESKPGGGSHKQSAQTLDSVRMEFKTQTLFTWSPRLISLNSTLNKFFALSVKSKQSLKWLIPLKCLSPPTFKHLCHFTISCLDYQGSHKSSFRLFKSILLITK